MTLFILAVAICTFVVPLYWVYKPPNFLIRHFQHRWPDVLWQVSTKSKVVALTIDDAPSEFTEEIMNILRENDAAATFFVIGSQVPGREHILEKLVANGNELGNHAMRDEPSRSLSDVQIEEQILAVNSMIEQAYNKAGKTSHPRLFRPGSGFFSDRMRRLVPKLGYRLVLGSIYPHDPQISYWRLNANHILSMLRPGGIIICHDRRSWTVPMLKKVIPEIRRRGYQIVTVSQLVQEAKG